MKAFLWFLHLCSLCDLLCQIHLRSETCRRLCWTLSLILLQNYRCANDRFPGSSGIKFLPTCHDVGLIKRYEGAGRWLLTLTIVPLRAGSAAPGILRLDHLVLTSLIYMLITVNQNSKVGVSLLIEIHRFSCHLRESRRLLRRLRQGTLSKAFSWFLHVWWLRLMLFVRESACVIYFSKLKQWIAYLKCIFLYLLQK